ncbi:family 78 glycoside hydrolase catalytic domain [Streptomyces sp. NPDC049954]|uniref:family 78 glycoside hydrolase catalytic domain n=1 Tax=Streptomyces sp. NPDC049954 TaxID=3155779 RepID=UPI0034140B26
MNPQNPATGAVTATLRPVEPTTERRAAPIGLDEAAPLLGWRLEAEGRGQAQRAYRIVLATRDPLTPGTTPLWDSGWTEGERTADIPYAGPPLAPRTAYQWRVQVTDAHGNPSPWSASAGFETGLAPGLPDADEALAAAWITAPGEQELAALPDLDSVDGEHDLYRIVAAPAGTGHDAPAARGEHEPSGPGTSGAGTGTGPGDGPGRPASASSAAPRATVFRLRFPARPAAVPQAARLLADGPGTLDAYLDGRRVPVDGSPSQELAEALSGPAGSDSEALAGSDRGHLLAVRVTTEDGTEPWLLAALRDGTPEPLPGPRVPHAAATGDHWRALRVPAAAEPDGGACPAWADPAAPDETPWPKAFAAGRNGDAPHGRSPLSHRPGPVLRRDFELPAPARRARLYATSLGLHELRINGRRVGDEELAPGWTDYDARVTYRAYDVTAQLTAGPNTLGALLADGWYAGNLCIFGKFHYGTSRALRALLVVDHPDGTTTTLATADDGTWRATRGAVLYSDLQNGEVHDARLEAPGWDRPGFDAAAWRPAAAVTPPAALRVLAPQTPPVRAQQEITAPLTPRPGGGLLADFGENVSGRVRLTVRGAAGSRVLLRHAEMLTHEGELYTEALRGARATDTYVLRGDPEGETWEPRFTTHGFRYCELLPQPAPTGNGQAGTGAEPPLVTSATAVVLWADMPATGGFETSHAGLSTLHRNIARSLRGNFLSVPTDCPQRDERMGWTGDIQVFAPTASFHHDVRGFLRGWLRELRGSQHADGAVPHTVPDMFGRVTPAQDLHGSAGAAGWGDAAVTVPAALLDAYDDRRAAAESLESAARWVGYLEEHSADGARPVDAFGDWLALSATPGDLVATAYAAHAARTAARLARALGEEERAAGLDASCAHFRAAFRERWVGGGGVLHPGTQTAYVLALHLGLLEPAEIPGAADRLAQEIASRGDHLTTGFLGTPWLLDALTDAGRIDVAHTLLLQDSYPSWLFPVANGATTVWERWNSWSQSGGFADPAMTSFNHYAYGAVGDWMYRTIGGLAPAEAGYRTVLVAPRPPAALTWARTSLLTDRGRITVDWERTGGAGFRLDVEVPPGASAEVRLPALPGLGDTLRESGRPAAEAEGVHPLDPPAGSAAAVRIGSGTYRFTLS